MLIKPYGDTLNDGAVQLSFTLPLADSAKAREAARAYVLKLGFRECEIVHSQSMSDQFTFFVAYGKSDVAVNLDEIQVVQDVQQESMNFEKVNQFIREKIGRKLVIVGACTGFDAHTVGIDAIMNMKGYDHHYGLERYPMVEAHNLGAQVPNARLIEVAQKLHADAILISQVVTQKDTHIHNLTEFIELLEAEGLRDKFICIVGGPRISNKLALELGYDAGFTKGTYAEHVATLIARKIADRHP
jgi:beta-lysine 5,6-aminomutase beta subunit